MIMKRELITKTKRIIAASLITVSILNLCACEEEEILYEIPIIEGINDISDDEQSEEVKITSKTIKDKVGATEPNWKENIQGGSGDAYISASILLPDAEDMYVIKAKEHYYSPEEKKKIANCLYDQGSVSVNIDKTPSKEWADKRIEICEEIMKNKDYYCCAPLSLT